MDKQYIHLDSGESVFFGRQLEFLKKETYDIRYADLKFRSLIPISNEVDPGAEAIRWESFDMVGIAKVIAAYADDLPRADIKGFENITPVRSLGASYGYSLQEIRAAKFAGKPLQARKAAAAKRAIEQKLNSIAFIGDASGLPGLINNANVPVFTLQADGTGSSKLWSTKTPAQVMRDLNAMVNFVVENTKGVEIPDTMLLPLNKFNVINTTPWSTTGDGSTIAQLFLKNNQYIKKIEWLNELTGAGVGGTDRAVVYRKDPMVLTNEIPQEFEQMDAEQRNLEFVIPSHARAGGTLIYYPLAVTYIDGF